MGPGLTSALDGFAELVSIDDAPRRRGGRNQVVFASTFTAMMVACGQQLASQAVGTEEAGDGRGLASWRVLGEPSRARRVAEPVELQPPRGKRFLDGNWDRRPGRGTGRCLTNAADDTIVIMDLATNSFLDKDYVQWRPSRIAAEQGVNCQVHLLGALASGVVGLSEEALAIQRDDLTRLLTGWSPYELTLADMPGKPTPARIDEIALAIGTAAHDEPVLPGLVGSRLRYSGHDDCYFVVESTDRAVPVALLSRLLALLAGSALAGASPVEVPDPASDRTAIYDVKRRLWRLATVSGQS